MFPLAAIVCLCSSKHRLRTSMSSEALIRHETFLVIGHEGLPSGLIDVNIVDVRPLPWE